jgi:hypothetical protein
MKKLAILVTCLLASVYTYGQGTISFSLFGLEDANGQVLVLDAMGDPAGGAYTAQLLVGAADDSLAPVDSGAYFYDGDYAGIIFGSEAVDAGLAAGSDVFVQVQAWATIDGGYGVNEFGQSVIGTATLGGAGSPPSAPGAPVGLESFQLAFIPEPSTIALGLLGGAALLLFRRRK